MKMDQGTTNKKILMFSILYIVYFVILQEPQCKQHLMELLLNIGLSISFNFKVDNNAIAYPVVHLLRTVEHIHHDAQGPSQVFGGLCLARPSRSSWGSAHG